jgi:hypothetical protein
LAKFDFGMAWPDYDSALFAPANAQHRLAHDTGIDVFEPVFGPIRRWN